MVRSIKISMTSNLQHILVVIKYTQILNIKTIQWRIQDFPEEGASTPGGRQYTILPKFPKNCMKLKEFGPRGRVPCALLDPPLLLN